MNEVERHLYGTLKELDSLDKLSEFFALILTMITLGMWYLSGIGKNR
jgi:hypothetical protein